MYWFFSVDDGTNDDRDQMIRFDVFFSNFDSYFKYEFESFEFKNIKLGSIIKDVITFRDF